MSIGEVATRAGLAASAIRYYEKQGLTGVAGRKNGRRVYDESILDVLSLIELARSAGFTIAEIRELMRGFERRTPPARRWQALTRSKLAELDRRILEAERMKRVLRTISRCRCPSLEDCGRAIHESRSSGSP